MLIITTGIMHVKRCHPSENKSPFARKQTSTARKITLYLQGKGCQIKEVFYNRYYDYDVLVAEDL
jgi:hypothetical protein